MMDETRFVRRYLFAFALVCEDMPGRVLGWGLSRLDVILNIVKLLRVFVRLLPLLQVLVCFDLQILSHVLLLLLESFLQVFGAHDERLQLSELADIGVVSPIIDPSTRVARLN